ncbi:MAG: NUDIX domain-containing protein [Lachnospiraceae bacterium]
MKAPKKPRMSAHGTCDSGWAGGHSKRPKKGLLAGLYELPNAEGHLSADEALKAVRRMGFSPIRIHPLPEAKHIFSHIEWQMQGYLVLVEDADAREAHTPLGNAQELLFVEPSRTERDYPIPAAFAAYVTSLDILLGQEKFDEAGETTVRNRLELACGRIQREKGDKNENSYDCNSVL